MAESFSEVNKHKKKLCEITSKIQEINTVQWQCSCLLKIQVTCNYCRCGLICSGWKITSWFLWFPSWFLIFCLDFWFLTLISDFLPWFLISSLDFQFNVLISDILTDFCDFFSWCTRFLCMVDPSLIRQHRILRASQLNAFQLAVMTVNLKTNWILIGLYRTSV